MIDEDSIVRYVTAALVAVITMLLKGLLGSINEKFKSVNQRLDQDEITRTSALLKLKEEGLDSTKKIESKLNELHDLAREQRFTAKRAKEFESDLAELKSSVDSQQETIDGLVECFGNEDSRPWH